MARLHLNDLETTVGEFVRYRLDRGGLAGALVAVEQDVVRVPAVEEGAGVLEHLLFLALVTRQVVQTDRVRVNDGNRRAIVLHGESRGLREEAVALAAVEVRKLRAVRERKRVRAGEIRKRTQGVRIKVLRRRLTELAAGEGEQAVQHLDVVGRGGEQGVRGVRNRVGEGVDVEMDRVQERAGNIAAGEALCAQCAVAVSEIRRRAAERGERFGIRMDERELQYTAQHGKRTQTQRKVGKLHGMTPLVFFVCFR